MIKQMNRNTLIGLVTLGSILLTVVWIAKKPTSLAAGGHLRLTSISLALRPQGATQIDSRTNLSALEMAATAGHTDCMILLLAYAADANRTGPYGGTPLHWASVARQPGAVSLLIKHGALIDAQDDQGRTPLHYACREACGQVIQVLVAAGADPSITAKNGETPADVVGDEWRAEILPILDKASNMENPTPHE